MPLTTALHHLQPAPMFRHRTKLSPAQTLHILAEFQETFPPADSTQKTHTLVSGHWQASGIGLNLVAVDSPKIKSTEKFPVGGKALGNTANLACSPQRWVP